MRIRNSLQKAILILCIAVVPFSCNTHNRKIDRKALVMRNNPIIDSVDSLSSLSVGNGGFAYTVDITGLQTFPRQIQKRGFTDLEKEFHIEGVYGRSIEAGAGMLQDLPLNPAKSLRRLCLKTLSGDVVIGLMSLTQQR